MKYTPKSIKRTLKKCITKISATPETYAKNPRRDFIRTRKLPFETVLKSVLSMTGKSLRGELMDLFALKLDAPTVSAFLQQRDKVNFQAFEDLFHSFVQEIDEKNLFKGYRLLAADGTDLHTPTNREEKESFYKGANGQRPYNLLHLNALYDLKRKIYTDAIIQGRKKENECKALANMVDRGEESVPTIYIADRGYESYNVMAHIIEKGQKFAIRVKDIGGNGIASRLKLRCEGVFDMDVSLHLTRKQTKAAKETLDYLPHNVNFDFLPTSCRKNTECAPYPLSFRLVRFEIGAGKYELLATNLTREEFALEELKELYAMRWGIETSFRDLKYSLALSYFHSKKTEHIFQEIFARLTMYNFAELITSHVTVKQKSGEHPYKVNFAAAVHICREFFLKNISPSLVEGLLLQYLLPIRNRPASPRMMRTKQAPTFSYRIP